jgi:hypothetical protein
LRSERIAQQPAVLVEAEQDALQVKGELLWVGVGPKVPLRDPAAKDARDRLGQIDLIANQLVAYRTGPVIELGRSRYEKAATRQCAGIPPQPVLEQRSCPRLPARSSQRWPDYQIHELVSSVSYRRQLQAFLRAEVSKQPAL